MKNITFFKTSGALFAVVILILTGCFSDFNPIDSDLISAGKGLVLLNVEGTQSKTVFPDVMNSFTYDLEFTKDDDTVNETLSGNLMEPIELEVGIWSLDVTAKHNGTAVGTASVPIVDIKESEMTIVRIMIVPIITGDNGTLNWTLAFNDNLVDSATVYIGKLLGPPAHTIELTDEKNGSQPLAPGSWLVRAVLEGNTGLSAGKSEIVHIYPGLDTALTFVFADTDFVPVESLEVSVAITTGSKVDIQTVTLVSKDNVFIDENMELDNGSWKVTIDIPFNANELDVSLTIETAAGTLQTIIEEITIDKTGSSWTAVMDAVAVYAVYGNITGGSVAVNGVNQTGAFQVDVQGGINVELEVVDTAAGYEFKSLMGNTSETHSITAIAADTEVTAVFEEMLVEAGTADPLAGQLLILQAYAPNAGAAGANRPFVELYNTTGAAINLNGINLYYADGNNTTIADHPWKMIALTGSIPSKGSFLVVGPHTSATGRLQIPDGYGDIFNSDFVLSNRAYKIAIIRTDVKNKLNVQNPFTMDKTDGSIAAGYIDMVGARNTEGTDRILGFETAVTRCSASEAVRRKDLNDTNNNSVDFIAARYAAGGLSDAEVEIQRPRNSSAGTWDPFPVIVEPPASVTIAGTGVAAGAVTIYTGTAVTLSAQFTPSVANIANVTYNWTVTNQTPAGVLTFGAANTATFGITGALAGTATVTLTVSGGAITGDISNSINVNVLLPPPPSETILILQANRPGNDNGGPAGFPRALVELYNKTDTAINLTTGNYYLHIGNAASWTHVIKLEGSIPALSSFLVVSSTSVNTIASHADFTPPGRAVLPAADQTADFNFGDGNNWKVALMTNQPTLTVNNPFTEPSLIINYIDMLGVGSANGFEGTAASSSQPQGSRRKSLIDTNINSADFAQVDYRSMWTQSSVRTPNADLHKIWPRNATMGAWDPITGIPVMDPTVRNPTTGVIEFPITGPTPPVATGLLILQANTHGNASGGFSKSLVELYNNSDVTIDFDIENYYLHIGDQTSPGWTSVIKLEGSIPSRTSFLIVSNNAAGISTPRAVLPAADQQADFVLSNDGFKVILMRNQSALLTVANPFTAESLFDNYVDMLGASGSQGFEGSGGAAQSRPQITRRISLTDTNDNSVDFKQIDIRSTATVDADLFKVWPRNVSLGAWDPETGLERIDPAVPAP